MPVVPPVRPPLVVVRPSLPGPDDGNEEVSGSSRTCRRCRRTFARHPSVLFVDLVARWLCPACDHERARRTSRVALRIVGPAPDTFRVPDPGPVPAAQERSR